MNEITPELDAAVVAEIAEKTPEIVREGEVPSQEAQSEDNGSANS